MLHDTQELFARAIITGEFNPELAGSLAALNGESAERFSVYRNTFLGTLTNALRLNFPAVERLVGRDYFAGAAGRFAVAHPPRSAYLNEFGTEFPRFLSTLPSAQPLAYLPGVARLDWAFSQALCAQDAPGVDLATLALSDSDDVRFILHPAISLLREDLPVDEVWHAVLSDDDAALTAIDLRHEQRLLLVEQRGWARVSSASTRRIGGC
ncbi:MAG: DNA-binding domain-containing protein [Alphaproteobacteria bacterium]